MTPLQLTAVALTSVAALYLWLTFGLLRQHGRLLIRVDALETRAGLSGHQRQLDEAHSLIARAGLPAVVRLGDALPPLQLPDLDGATFDLSTLRGRKVVLLFWDSGNANCASMEPDLKTHERLHLADAPELLILASGSASATRAFGFGSRVLMDPKFVGRTLFGAQEAPAAVLVDEQGRMASALHVGYVPAFEVIGLVPFVPTADDTVQAMLTLASVGAGDVVYDLGCGDGRVVVAAAKAYGARGIGVDINPDRLDEARARAQAAGVEHLVRFEEGELANIDLREATVVTMYLLPQVNMQLRSKLRADLKPGTRVVSHGFDMDDWKPDQEIVANGDTLYLWTIR